MISNLIIQEVAEEEGVVADGTAEGGSLGQRAGLPRRVKHVGEGASVPILSKVEDDRVWHAFGNHLLISPRSKSVEIPGHQAIHNRVRPCSLAAKLC